MLIVYILIFIVVFIYLLFIKNRYQPFNNHPEKIIDILNVKGHHYNYLLKTIEPVPLDKDKDFNTKIKAVYDQVFKFLSI